MRYNILIWTCWTTLMWLLQRHRIRQQQVSMKSLFVKHLKLLGLAESCPIFQSYQSCKAGNVRTTPPLWPPVCVVFAGPGRECKGFLSWPLSSHMRPDDQDWSQEMTRYWIVDIQGDDCCIHLQPLVDCGSLFIWKEWTSQILTSALSFEHIETKTLARSGEIGHPLFNTAEVVITSSISI